MIDIKKEIDKNNAALIIVYLILLSIAAVGYLFMVAFTDESYNVQMYKNAYVYFIGFQLLLFSIIFPYWNINKEDNVLDSLIHIVIFSTISIPIMLMITILGNLNSINFVIPVFVQILWGAVILSAKKLIDTVNVLDNLKYFFLQMIAFLMIAGSLVVFYFYYKYGNLVITTIFDKDIPKIFFINPIAVALGSAYIQVGGDTQLGNLPIVYMSIFNGAVILLNCILVKKRRNTYLKE